MGQMDQMGHNDPSDPRTRTL